MNDGTKKIGSGELKPGMLLVEKDGALLEVVQVVHKSDCVHIAWKSCLGMSRGDTRLSLIKLVRVLDVVEG